MDAMEFIRERNRMCKAFPSCKGCPACDFDGCGSVHLNEGIIPIVEKWAKEHPRKTRQSAPRELGEFWQDCPEYSELSTNCWTCENVCGDGDETDCDTDGRRYLRRPPQSWCYVEEMEKGETE